MTAADCKQLEKWWNDGSIMAHAGFPNGLGTTAEEIWEKTKNDSDTTRRRLMILYKGAAIGEMAYFNLGDDTAEIGIKIFERNFQEKGLGRLVLSLLLKELFSMGYKKSFWTPISRIPEPSIYMNFWVSAKSGSKRISGKTRWENCSLSSIMNSCQRISWTGLPSNGFFILRNYRLADLRF